MDLSSLSNEALLDLYKKKDQEVKVLSFRHFVIYNKRDAEILVQIERKFRYIELANRMVHEATVNFSAVYGSVQLIDTAFMNYCHREFKKILFDRPHREDRADVEGALVMSPKVGLHRWVGACDINSLYPSTYRTLNLSPEKVIGQLTAREAGWRAVYDHVQNPGNDLYALRKLNLTLDAAHDPEGFNLTVAELVDMLKAERYALSAHGTILDQSCGIGLIPAVLGNWFNGRREMQTLKKKFEAEAREILKNGGNELYPAYIHAKAQAEYYDMLQGVRKVLLNSSYGATLNPFCRFFDQRLGSSTTDTGRQITTHMVNTVSKNLIGDGYPKLVKTVVEVPPKELRRGGNGGAAVAAAKGISNEYDIAIPPKLGPFYGDTDSVYFTMEALVDNVDDAVSCADAVVDEVNASFPGFIRTAFFCQPGFDDLIRANREIVASAALFRAKKKYVLLVVDKEGTRIPEGHKSELKTQGSDIKLSSTPETIREFLKTVTLMILRGKPKSAVDEYVLDFRLKFSADEADGYTILDYATVTSVKELDKYFVQWERIEKPGLGRAAMPAGARAVINHNECLKLFGDQDTQPIIAGQKIKMIWLKPNEHNFTNIAFSSDLEVTPPWFDQNFGPDLKATEIKLIDRKLNLIFEPIGWQVPTPQTVRVGKLFEF